MSVLEGEEIDPDEAIRRQAARQQGPSAEAQSLFGDYQVEFAAGERGDETTNGPFKLLLRLLEWNSDESTSSPSLRV